MTRVDYVGDGPHSPKDPVHIRGLHNLKAIPQSRTRRMPLHILVLYSKSRVQVRLNVVEFVSKETGKCVTMGC